LGSPPRSPAGMSNSYEPSDARIGSSTSTRRHMLPITLRQRRCR
jgi:hypothetical protein